MQNTPGFRKNRGYRFWFYKEGSAVLVKQPEKQFLTGTKKSNSEIAATAAVKSVANAIGEIVRLRLTVK